MLQLSLRGDTGSYFSQLSLFSLIVVFRGKREVTICIPKIDICAHLLHTYFTITSISLVLLHFPPTRANVWQTIAAEFWETLRKVYKRR